jgi:hypothetical protein
MARKPKTKGASKEASALLSAFIAKVAPPLPYYDERLEAWRQEFGRRVGAAVEAIRAEMAPNCPMPETIPCLTPEQTTVRTIQDQFRTMAQHMPEAVAALDIVMPGIVEGEKTKPGRVAALIKAAQERAALLIAVKQVCKDRRIKRLSKSQPYAEQLRPHIIARLRKMTEVPGAAGLIKKPRGPSVKRLLEAFADAQPASEGCRD